MASWQYRSASDRAPVVPTDKGYFVDYPYNAHAQPGESGHRYTVKLDFNGNELYLWVHEISMSFQIGGSFAQSAYYHQFYPHNMTQPSVTLTGQTLNQEQYGEIVEFIRQSQRWSLRPVNDAVGLTIPKGGIQKNATQGHRHENHDFRGHIKSIQRNTERFVNAPEFTFEFIVVTAGAGIFSIEPAEKTMKQLAMYMQIPNPIRSQRGKHTGTVNFALDPDPQYIDTKNNTVSDIPPNKI